MEKTLTGQCLCGQVVFTVQDHFKAFYQCHCKQCQQLTGTAYASNLFTEPANIHWQSGGDQVATYEHPERSFSKAFCKHCGSALPFLNKTKTALIVPAGCLDEAASIDVEADIFTDEAACWSNTDSLVKRFPGFPE
ncbi:MAG: aldehyde-activating protein [Cellvibrionaceae bacterium]|nr:aldehyde-activating protein [Cellvibrionaceae bacterium]